MPKDLVNYNWFPTEVADVLKWSSLICSVPVAFKGVWTRVLVDAPGKSSGKQQQNVSHEHLLPTLHSLFAHLRNGKGFVAPEGVDSDVPRQGISLPPPPPDRGSAHVPCFRSVNPSSDR